MTDACVNDVVETPWIRTKPKRRFFHVKSCWKCCAVFDVEALPAGYFSPANHRIY